MRTVLARATLLTMIALVALGMSGTAFAAPAVVGPLDCPTGIHICVVNGRGADACPRLRLCLYDGFRYNEDYCRWCLWGGGTSDRILVTDLHTEPQLSYRPGISSPSGQGIINLYEIGFANATSSFVNNTPHVITVYGLDAPPIKRPPLWNPSSIWPPLHQYWASPPKSPPPLKPLFTIVPGRCDYVGDGWNDKALLLRVQGWKTIP